MSIYDALKASYGKKKNENNLMEQGYRIDRSLSNHNQQVYHNANQNKMLFTVSGTHNLKDVGTDLWLMGGNLKGTNRYKQAKRTLDQAKQKYNGAQTTIAGHSLGGSITNYLGNKNDTK